MPSFLLLLSMALRLLALARSLLSGLRTRDAKLGALAILAGALACEQALSWTLGAEPSLAGELISLVISALIVGLVILCERVQSALVYTDLASRREHVRLEAVLDTAADSIVWIDELGIICGANMACEELFGYKSEELLGQNVSRLMPAPYRDEHDGYIARYLETGEAKIIGERRELLGLKKDGSTFPLELAVSEADRNGERHFVGIIHDLSRRQATLEKLRRSEAQIKAIVSSAVDAIISIDERGRMRSANPACERLFGYSAEELIGQNVSVLMPSPYRDEHDGYLSRYLETGEKKIIGIGREAVGLKKDGSTFPLDLAVSEARVGDERLFIGIVRDLTVRKDFEKTLRESERRFRSLVQTAGTVILGLSPDYAVTEWNAEAERVFGWSREEALGRGDPELFPTNGAWEGLRSGLKKVIEGENFRDFENVVEARDGTERTMLWNATRMLDDEGAVIGLIACGQDITDYKGLLQRLMEQSSLVRLGEMAAVVAHEVRNPLAGVCGALRIIEGRIPEDNPDRAIVKEMGERLNVLNEIVDDLLVFARPQKPNIRRCPVQLLIEDTALLARDDERFSEVEVCIEDSELIVACDPELLKPVFLNFLINAAQAMDGQGRIHVSSRGDAERCTIAFKDDGPGIPEDARARIFEPFFTTKTRGTGLGLAVARRIIELHEGRIAVACPEEGGTVMTVTLPLG